MKSSLTTAAGLAVGTRSVDGLGQTQFAQTSGSPTVVSTWPFGLPANERAWELVESGADALDAAVEGAAVCENDPNVTTVGRGGFPNTEGVVQLDASVMHGPTRRCGAVGALERIANAAAVARRVMEETPHIFLVAQGALDFARQHGFAEEELLTAEMQQRWQRWRDENTQQIEGHDTLGILVLDQAGTISGACTTSGLAWKLPGRVGDSPLIGAGLFVDGEVGGATGTGHGEEIIRVNGSFLIVELMRQGWEPQAACDEACDRIVRNHPGASEVPNAAFLALRIDGTVGAACVNEGGFEYALSDAEGHRMVAAPGRRTP